MLTWIQLSSLLSSSKSPFFRSWPGMSQRSSDLYACSPLPTATPVDSVPTLPSFLCPPHFPFFCSLLFCALCGSLHFPPHDCLRKERVKWNRSRWKRARAGRSFVPERLKLRCSSFRFFSCRCSMSLCLCCHPAYRIMIPKPISSHVSCNQEVWS